MMRLWWRRPFWQREAAAWVRLNGLQVESGGIVWLAKAVTRDYESPVWGGTSYKPGETPRADRWRPNGACGRGLHFCATPQKADYYGPIEATRYMLCPVKITEICVIDMTKVKAKRVVAPGCREVNIHGEPIPTDITGTNVRVKGSRR